MLKQLQNFQYNICKIFGFVYGQSKSLIVILLLSLFSVVDWLFTQETWSEFENNQAPLIYFYFDSPFSLSLFDTHTHLYVCVRKC